MKIAIVGAGKLGTSLGRRWSENGHDVVYGVRDPSDPKHQALGAQARRVAEAVAAADAVVISVPWREVEGLIPQLGDLGTKVVIDTTNPLGAGPQDAGFTSGSENIAAWSGSGRVVKAFNTTGAGNMANPVYPGGRPVMFIAGDDADAKEIAKQLAGQIGFQAEDAGPLTGARDLEHLAALWTRMAYGLGQGPNFAYALLSDNSRTAGRALDRTHAGLLGSQQKRRRARVDGPGLFRVWMRNYLRGLKIAYCCVEIFTKLRYTSMR